ncbi:membrane protein YdbS with pleckstrin-like domain [Arcanobacterium hippocoleae]|uniref:Membrane protein YdbS with pleckstrin-like domain n=2 Tax=Arcanobacterium hippocoleae TaxID=149017 RepID=A0ABU1T242_9ACTO|nr:membrane protein YdbS with pleckstrin-like domain [Arcanobacterium hippocoleae]
MNAAIRLYRIPDNWHRRSLARNLVGILVFSIVLGCVSLWPTTSRYSLLCTLVYSLIVLLSCCDVFVLTPMAMRHTTVYISDAELSINRGKTWLRVTRIPRKRINSVRLSQSLLSRKYSHARLVVTATTAVIDLPILSLADAQQIADEIASG